MGALGPSDVGTMGTDAGSDRPLADSRTYFQLRYALSLAQSPSLSARHVTRLLPSMNRDCFLPWSERRRIDPGPPFDIDSGWRGQTAGSAARPGPGHCRIQKGGG